MKSVALLAILLLACSTVLIDADGPSQYQQFLCFQEAYSCASARNATVIDCYIGHQGCLERSAEEVDD